MCLATFMSLGMMLLRPSLNRYDGAILIIVYFAYIAVVFTPTNQP
jgi:hypothetical protein